MPAVAAKRQLPTYIPRSNRPLTTVEVDKWMSMSEIIIKRKDGRDALCYETLLRGLRQLRELRWLEGSIERTVDELVAEAERLRVPKKFRDLLTTIYVRARERLEKIHEPKEDLNWNPETAVELKRAGVLTKVNDTLKPEGFVLVLHYGDDDINQEDPIAATFENWPP